MAKEIVLITGGARSGKSRYAEESAIRLGTKLLYLATGEPGDEEMARRIAEHRKRRGDRWLTVEEPLEVGSVLAGHCGKIDCALVDCLTLWVSNLLIRGGEELVRNAVEKVIQRNSRLDFHLLLVTNEVGWGIVPDNALARQFRDLAGWTNQRMAEIASEVVLMVAGIPVVVKK
ncbi:bifunctional adenosylcobinamide kinase/adenosylcobinamide-phosphate guanylyltransferase [bacterium]|nr:MAG: bifunctional adenosylcobinamide kinase/adenosylcobinamide-phosphate guanylyltransferase [bacterium]